ncbi:hypothetical protein T01_13034 [Trichinella spiralis]|uniref:Uncharacterized protein n=1 Tax=Trichinella spiralis TaxID=6334 RepID=A0A0V1AYX1_TRISP|nr:hypothetical protein T01_13034 [Trichinella spiralis]
MHKKKKPIRDTRPALTVFILFPSGRLTWVDGRVHSNASKLLGGAIQPPQVNSHRDGQLLANGQEHRQTAARGYPLCKTSLNASNEDFRHVSLEQC